jgi:class 3 adenylate cyclase
VPAPQLRADELRPITVLFADIVGSTALGERLGPGEVKALIGECLNRMSRAAETYGGAIQAYAGDGICVYFGLPVAHEDDPERAALAALRILQVIGEYGRDVESAWGIPNFNVRIGINSGQAGVGLVGARDPQEVALGDATNIAARLEALADPGAIVVGGATARRLAKAFALHSLGEVIVKGRGEPVLAYRLVGTGVVSRQAVAPPLIGREEEMNRLYTALTALESGRGQVLLLLGEAGLGKTRLLAELRAVCGDRVTWLEGRCLSYGAEFVSWPFVEILRGWLDAMPDEPEVAVRMKLRARAGPLLDSRSPEALPYLGRLLSVRIEPGLEDPLARLQPDVLAERLRKAYAGWIEALSTDRPVVLALDDLQWAAPTTTELVEGILPLTDRAPILVVMALRPDPASEGWRIRSSVTRDYLHRAVEIPLAPLSDAQSLQLAEALVPAGMVSDAIVKGIVARAEGNPLYVEELLRSVTEEGEASHARSWSFTIPTGQVLPGTLESLLVSRIDRLPSSARRLAQAAAVIGRNFEVRVLQRVMDGQDILEDLGVLLRASIVQELRRFPQLICTFRHGLMQEAALSSLPKARLRDLYGRVAFVCEDVFASSIEEHLADLAFYYYRSDKDEKALEYLERAGNKAARLHANAQAVRFLARARKVSLRLGDEAAEFRLREQVHQLEADLAAAP